MGREGAGGVGDITGKAEAKVLRGGSQVVGSWSTGFKSQFQIGPGDTAKEVSLGGGGS